jgi:cobalt-zinc-cadmium efflux system outer membrane protein
MDRIRISIIALTISFTTLSFGQTESLQELINTAIEVSPKIKMLEMKKQAASNRIEQNSNLPDPMLTLGLMNLPTNSFSFTQEPMTGKIIGLSQMFPFPGKLSAISDAATVDTAIVSQEIKDAENEIRKMVSLKYYALSYIRKALLYSQESKNLLEKISDVVSTKYTVTKASQQNLIKVQLELTRISDKIEDLKSKEASVVAELNALLLRDAGSEISTEFYEQINYINFSANQLDSLSRLHRPYLKGIELFNQKEKFKQNIAEKDYYPNFTLGVQYSFRDEIAKTKTPLNDFFSVMVGISLPLNYGGKVSAKVQESVSMQEFYSDQYSLAVQKLNGEFGSAVSQLASLEERIKLFEDGLLPQAQQNLKSALASYQVNEVDFINVIDAEDQLFKIETNLYKLKTDYLKQIADLEFLTGTSLPAGR